MMARPRVNKRGVQHPDTVASHIELKKAVEHFSKDISEEEEITIGECL